MRTPSTTASDFDSRRGATAWARAIASSSSASPKLFLAALCASLLALALAAAPASAARPYESQLTEANGSALSNPFGLSVDGSGNLWVSDTGSTKVSKFSSSGSYEAQDNGSGSWGTSPYIEGVAFSEAAAKVFVSDSNADDLWGLESSAAYSGTDLNSGLGGGCCYIRVAADNSGGQREATSTSPPARASSASTPPVPPPTSAPPSPTFRATLSPAPFHPPEPLPSGPPATSTSPAAPRFTSSIPPEPCSKKSPNSKARRSARSPRSPIDPSNENVLVAEAGAIDEFTADGESLAKITEANGAAFGGIRASPSTPPAPSTRRMAANTSSMSLGRRRRPVE